VLEAPAVVPDIPAYTSPVDGRLIEGRRAREEDLKRNGCVPWEPGMRQDVERKQRELERETDRMVDSFVEEAVTQL
jgi:hypothetical protein